MNTPEQIAAEIEKNTADLYADRETWEDFKTRQRALWGKADDLGIANKVGVLLTVNRSWGKAA